MQYRFSRGFSALAPSAIREILKNSDPNTIAFSAGNPNALSFPIEELARLSADIFLTQSTLALQYGTTEGYLPLREVLAKRSFERFGIGKDFDTTMITSGGQQGLELCCRVLCDEGDVVLCEEPTFIGALNAFRAVGAKTVGVPLEDDGMNLEILEEKLKNTPNVRMIYCISNFQNPSGICTSLSKRQAIYALAKQYGVIILEDNPYGELRFAGEEIPPIKSMDCDGIVVYCSSFSKLLSAGMRVGFVIAPEAIVAKMTVGKQCEDVHTNLFFQILCHRFMTECDFDAHIENIRKLYAHKCHLMQKALDDYMPDGVTHTSPEGGLFIWCTIPEHIAILDFVNEAKKRKVAFVPGFVFNPDETGRKNAFRMTYATPSDEDITRGVKILGDILKEMLA